MSRLTMSKAALLHKITIEPWGNVAFPVIEALGGDNHARFVGGCVRNALLGVTIHDIDLATTHPPERVLERLEASSIKALPTGLQHGTVTAVIDKTPIEITTLRIDTKTNGRHAEVQFSESWEDDASRRDFTMNALYADREGRLYDPLGTGIQDATNRNVKFIGDACKRIEEDALRILRYFRFFAHYALDAPDPQAIEACAAEAHRVHDLSRERITQEILKTLIAPRSLTALRLMKTHHIWGLLEGVEDNFESLETLRTRQNDHNATDVLARLCALNLPLPALETSLSLSNTQKRTLKTLRTAKAQPLNTQQDLKKSLYHHGRPATLQAYLTQADTLDKEFLNTLKTWPIPKFPITGADLIKEGYTQGEALGQELKRREKAWVDNNFQI